MKNILCQICCITNKLRELTATFIEPVFLLVIRLFMANVFFTSGWSKFKNYLNDNWEATLFLFRDIHPLPLIPHEIAAILGTGGEIIFSVLLAIGLFARFGAIGLLIMTISIQFFIPAEYGLMNMIHYFWMFLLGMIIIRGAGCLSLDALFSRKCSKSK